MKVKEGNPSGGSTVAALPVHTRMPGGSRSAGVRLPAQPIAVKPTPQTIRLSKSKDVSLSDIEFKRRAKEEQRSALLARKERAKKGLLSQKEKDALEQIELSRGDETKAPTSLASKLQLGKANPGKNRKMKTFLLQGGRFQLFQIGKNAPSPNSEVDTPQSRQKKTRKGRKKEGNGCIIM